MSSIQYIRDRYQVPAKVGGVVRLQFSHGTGATGTIVGADAHLIVRPNNPPTGASKRYRWYLHPTWRVEYLNASGEVIWPVTPDEQCHALGG